MNAPSRSGTMQALEVTITVVCKSYLFTDLKMANYT